jgi:hypothetical protein
MDRSDMVLMVVAALVAVVSLVQLMRRRRDWLMADIKRQFDEHRQREEAAEAERKRNEQLA